VDIILTTAFTYSISSLPVWLLTNHYLHLHLTSTVFSAACTTASVGVVFSSKDAIKLPANTVAASLDVAATAFTNSPVKVFAVVEVVTMIDSPVDLDGATVVEVVIDASSLVIFCIVAAVLFMIDASVLAAVVLSCLTAVVLLISGFRVTTHRVVTGTTEPLPTVEDALITAPDVDWSTSTLVTAAEDDFTTAASVVLVVTVVVLTVAAIVVVLTSAAVVPAATVVVSFAAASTALAVAPATPACMRATASWRINANLSLRDSSTLSARNRNKK